MSDETVKSSFPGLSAEEAKEFQNQFRMGTVIFGLFALVAHALVWAWKPWF